MTARKHYTAAAACLLPAALLVGCDSDGRVRPPSVEARVVHAAPTTPAIEFLREEDRRNAVAVDYRQASGRLSWDADLYDFNVDLPQPGGGARRLASFSSDLTPGNEYLFVITEVDDSVEPIVVEQPVFDAGDGDDGEVAAVHAAPALTAMDVYVEAPDIDPAGAAPLGGLAFGDVLEPATRPAGDYRVTLTARGDASDVRLVSPTITLDAGQSFTFVIVDGLGDGVAPLGVLAVGPDGGLLLDRDTPSAIHVVNAAADTNERDVVVDDGFAEPAVAALPFATFSDVTPLPPGGRTISVTPAGNPGVVEAEAELSAVRGRRHTQLIAGEPGELSIATRLDDARRISGEARMRFLNAAGRHSPLQVFLVDSGEELDESEPAVALDAPQVTQRQSVRPGDYDLYLRDRDSETVVAGPVALTLGEGVYTVLAINGAEPGTVDVALLEDFE